VVQKDPYLTFFLLYFFSAELLYQPVAPASANEYFVFKKKEQPEKYYLAGWNNGRNRLEHPKLMIY
jgi:hypothetical protein